MGNEAPLAPPYRFNSQLLKDTMSAIKEGYIGPAIAYLQSQPTETLMNALASCSPEIRVAGGSSYAEHYHSLLAKSIIENPQIVLAHTVFVLAYQCYVAHGIGAEKGSRR